MNNDINIAYRAGLWNAFTRNYENLTKGIDDIHDFYASHESFSKKSHKLIAQRLYLYGIFSCLDSFLSDSAVELLVSYPGKIGNLKNDTELLTEVMTLTEAIKFHAEKRINELTYKRPIEFITEFYGFFGERVFLDEIKLGQIVEGKATRDLFMHNGGKVNYVYFEKSGKFSRNLIEKSAVEIDDDYLYSLKNTILEIGQDILSRRFSKHVDDTPAKIFRKMWEMSSLSRIVPFEKQWHYSAESIRGEGIYIKEYQHYWSGSEQVLFNFFRQIHSKDGPQSEKLSVGDIPHALYRWKGRPDERIIQSWLEAQFHL